MGANQAPPGYRFVSYFNDRFMVIGVNGQGKTLIRWYKGTSFVDAPVLNVKEWATAFEQLLKSDEIANSRSLSHVSLRHNVARPPLEENLSEGRRAIFASERKITIGPIEFARAEEGRHSESCLFRLVGSKVRVSEIPLELGAEFAAWFLSDPILLTQLKNTPGNKDMYRPWLKRRKPECFDEQGYLIKGRENDFISDPSVHTPSAVPVFENTLTGEIEVADTVKVPENPAGLLRWHLQQVVECMTNHGGLVPPGLKMASSIITSSVIALDRRGIEECRPSVEIDTTAAEAKLRALQEELERVAVARLTEMRSDLTRLEHGLRDRENTLSVAQQELATMTDALARERAKFEGEKLRIKGEMEMMQLMMDATAANLAESS